MKILIITPRIPFPPFRGDKLKIYNLCKILKQNHKVHILTFLSNSSDEINLNSLKKEKFSIDVIKLTRFQSFLNLIRSVFSYIPFQVSYYYSIKMKNKIKELSSEENFDVVYFHLINSVQYFDAVKTQKSLKVIDFTDATSLYLKRYLDFIKNPIRKLFFNIELKRVLRYEKKTQKFDTLFVCSPVDREYLIQRNIHNNIQLLLNGIDVDNFQYQKIDKEKGRIIFVGNMTYFPNIDAVIYFSNEILPLILTKLPDTKFYIVGQNPTQEVIDLQSKNIIVTGFVDKLNNEYLKSEVNIAPIRFGSGTLNKIIEAIALGIPTVATSLATQGFSDEIKQYIHIKDEPEEFAKEIISILKNQSQYYEEISNAKKLIIEKLNWEKIVRDFEEYLKNRINR